MDLITAVNGWDLERVIELCDQGVNVDFQRADGATALMLASEVLIVKELCDRGANLEIQDKQGRTALVWCVIFNDLPAAKELCKRGAKAVDTDSPYDTVRALLTAQQFKRNVLVLVDHIQIEILRCVHKWMS